MAAITCIAKTSIMGALALILLFLPSILSSQMGNLGTSGAWGAQHASLPPRGWNSYDSFTWIVSEEEFLENAWLVSKLLRYHGYEYVVVDYLWYRKNVNGSNTDSLGFDVIDEWGRVVPDPKRWPSSIGGKGFSEVAHKVHAMGLKFGIHVMRGISTQAVNANTPILDITTGKAYEESGRVWHAKDIGIPEKACAWMPHGFMSVNVNLGAGRAFLRSLYQQYAEWGLDFVKHDCVFGNDFDIDEISYVSQVLADVKRPILYSLSPGTGVTPSMARQVNGLVNMYRITGDDWDKWADVSTHFDISRDVASAGMIGAHGLEGKSWPDLDMLPLGWITSPDTNKGPYRQSNLTLDEQRTQMTLWSMAKSPLMYGGDMRRLDRNTLAIITNPTLLEINSFSSNNREFPFVVDENCSSSGNSSLACKSSQSKEQLALALISCKDAKSESLLTQGVNDHAGQICFKQNPKSEEPFCLHKQPKLSPLSSKGKSSCSGGTCGNQVQLLSSKGKDLCLSAAANRKLTSGELYNGLFSPCSQDATQVWEISPNGNLKSSYNGLCASFETANAPAGVRSWIATGRRGEIYLAFFNMKPAKTVISAQISDISKALPAGRNISSSCVCTELWSGQKFGVVKDKLSIEVMPHASALFTLYCS